MQSIVKITMLLSSFSIISARLMEGSLNGVVLNGRGGLGRLQRHLEGRDNVSYYPNGDPYWAYRSGWSQNQYQNQYQTQYQSQYQYPQYQYQQYQYQPSYQYPQYPQYRTAYQPQQYYQRYQTFPTYKTSFPSNSYVLPYGYSPKRM